MKFKVMLSPKLSLRLMLNRKLMPKLVLRPGPRVKEKQKPSRRLRAALIAKLKLKVKARSKLMLILMPKQAPRPRASFLIRSRRSEKVWLRELLVGRPAHQLPKR